VLGLNPECSDIGSADYPARTADDGLLRISFVTPDYLENSEHTEISCYGLTAEDLNASDQ
jgi:hypothetical protein